MATSPLRRSAFRRLVAARSAVIVGNSVAPIALAFAVLDITHSASALGLVVASRSLANVAVLLLGGVLADRFPRHHVLLAASLAAAATQAAVVAVLLTGSATIPMLAILAALNGAAAGVALPASSALVPTTVPRYLLRPANAILRLAVNTGSIVGAAAGSLLVAWLGSAAGIAIDAGTFLISGLLFSTIREYQGALDKIPIKPTSFIQDLKVGWSEFAGRRWLWVVVAQLGVVNAAFTGATAILGPIVADETFGRGLWGVILAAETAGLVAGGLLGLKWRPRRALTVGVSLTAVTAIPLLALASRPPVWLLACAFFVAGAAIEQFSIAWDQSLQTHIATDRLARVYSYDALGSYAAIPIGEALIGPLAAGITTPLALVICSGAIAAATAAALTQQNVRSLSNESRSAH